MSVKLRHFPFFKYHEVLEKSTRSSFSLLKDINIACIACGKEYIIIGDSEGCIYSLNKLLSSFSLKFGAYSSYIVFMYMSQKIPFLFCVGYDHGESKPILKVFDLKTTSNQGIPFCSKQFKIGCSDENAIVSTVAIYERLTQMAVGFSSGAIIIFKGDILGKKSLKENEIRKFNTTITGLQFMKEEENLFLFITTLESVSYIHIQKSIEVSIIDSIGCNPKCCTIFENQSSPEFYVANESALNCYTSAGRTKCIPIPGNKGFLKSFKNNLVLTLKSGKMAGIKGVPLSKMDSLQILTIDDKVKYLSFIRDVPDVIDIAYIWGSVYVFLSNGQLYELIEMDLENKIKILFNKNLYDLAINLAKPYSDKNVLNQIICKFGDYLYTKGDLEQAMVQYVQTIETIEPSYIIKKFLDAQNIHHLATYLESLHESSLANSDHTTLLLNCYIRLKETDKLDEFLRADRLWHFDPETALRVCHQAGFIEQALVLARKTNQHSWYLKILLEDVKDYRSALEYLKKLKIADAELVLKNYGRRLLKDTPKELVEFLKFICTRSSSNPNPCLPEDFIHIFVQQRSYLRIFLEYIISVNNACSNQVYNTLIELYVYEIADCKNPAEKVTLESKCLNIISFEEDKYDTDHALMLCQLNNFIKGLVALYVKTHKFSMILQHHMESKDYENVVGDCIKYGSFEPRLWKMSLEYLTQNYEECEEYLKEVLSLVNQNNMITPIDMISILSQSDKTQVRLIRDYISERFNHANTVIAKNNESIEKDKQEIDEIKNDINIIETGEKVFQNSKCSLCENTLELPVVHYFCGHSYHQNCSDSVEFEGQCNICFQKSKSLLAAFETKANEKQLLQTFEKEILESSDPFKTAFKYFKYDIFNRDIFSD